MDQLAVVKSNTNTEGESFVGLHTLMYRVRRVDERHIRALGNAHYNDYAAANVKSMTSDTCFFSNKLLKYHMPAGMGGVVQCAGGPFNSIMLP